MSIVTEKRLKDRSGSLCEISGSDEDLVLYLVEPKTEDIPENCILITQNLKNQIENPETMNANDWRGVIVCGMKIFRCKLFLGVCMRV